MKSYARSSRILKVLDFNSDKNAWLKGAYYHDLTSTVSTIQ
jgi:hypothetical protein